MIEMQIPKVRNLNLLAKATKKRGLTLDVNKKSAQYWAGNKMQCDAVISCPGSKFEIAVKKDDKGEYAMFMDPMDSLLNSKAGKGCGLISQAYQIEEHKKAARNAGKEVIGCVVDSNGTIVLRVKA